MDALIVRADKGNAWMRMDMIFFGHRRWNANNYDGLVLGYVIQNGIKIGQHKFIADIPKTSPFFDKGPDMASHIDFPIT
jgi:hypothetical protein